MPIKVLMIFLIIQYSLQKNNSLHDYYIINWGGDKKKYYYKVNVNIFNTYHTASSDIYFSMQFVINAGLNDQSFIFMKYNYEKKSSLHFATNAFIHAVPF